MVGSVVASAVAKLAICTGIKGILKKAGGLYCYSSSHSVKVLLYRDIGTLLVTVVASAVAKLSIRLKGIVNGVNYSKRQVAAEAL